jgi:hypothetical protein
MRLLGTALVEDMELVIACGASFKTHSHWRFKNWIFNTAHILVFDAKDI